MPESAYLDATLRLLRRRHSFEHLCGKRDALLADGDFGPANQPNTEAFALAAEGALVLVHGSTLERNAEDRSLFCGIPARAQARLWRSAALWRERGVAPGDLQGAVRSAEVVVEPVQA